MESQKREQKSTNTDRAHVRALFRQRQNKILKMVSVGVIDDTVSFAYDIIGTVALLANLTAGILDTFEQFHAQFGPLFAVIETVTVAFFAVDYALRLYSAGALYPDRSGGRAVLRYMTSGAGIIDLMSFLPYCLPFFFPAGLAAFRMFRVARIFRLFRINAYYDSLNVISEVISSKRQQLLSSVFIIVTLMLASSLCMYSLEHEAQPDVFTNAFSGIWWSASTLLTVGYGDIYPVTTLGKIFGIIITFLGVGMVAIPTGIISAGFVEQYTRLKRLGDQAEEDIRFLQVILSRSDAWTGKAVRELGLPGDMILAAIQRGAETIIPRGETIMEPGDRLVLASGAMSSTRNMKLKKITLGRSHQWNGCAVRELNISRQAYIVMVRRGRGNLIPFDDLILLEGDVVFIFDKSGSEAIENIL